MPKIKGLTEKQKAQHEMEKRRRDIVGGLHAYKGLNHRTNVELAQELGVGENTVTYLLRGDEVRLTPTQWLRIVSLAGLTVERLSN